MEDKNNDTMMANKEGGTTADGTTADGMMDENEDDMMDEAMMDEKEDDMMDEAMMDEKEDDMVDEAMMDEMEDTMMATPTWFKMPLTDVHTGESFTISDLKGKVILVETMAIWCSNCLQQQQQVQSLHASLSERDDFISLAINIDPNEQADALKTYTMRHGFNWLYTVAPAELSRELAQLYGNQVLNPPSVPMFIIDREGEVHPLPFGIKSAEALQQALQPFLEM